LKTWITINEARILDHLEPIPGGDVLMTMPGQMAGGGGENSPNQEEPSKTKTEPEEGSPNESTLLDRTLNG
jgi:hypothetical protein